MKVVVRLFASARERVQAAEIEVAVTEGATLRDLQGAMVAAFPALRKIPGRWAVNRSLAPLHLAVRPDDEISWIPPVSGG